MENQNTKAGAYVRPGYEGDPTKHGSVKKKNISKESLFRIGNFLSLLANKYFRDEKNKDSTEIIETDHDFLEILLTEWEHISTGWDSENTGCWLLFINRSTPEIQLLYSIRESKAKLLFDSNIFYGEEERFCTELVNEFKVQYPYYVKSVDVFVNEPNA